MSIIHNRSLTAKQLTLIDDFKLKMQGLEDDIKKLPPSRELAVAITKLEEASMWLSKAIYVSDI